MQKLTTHRLSGTGRKIEGAEVGEDQRYPASSSHVRDALMNSQPPRLPSQNQASQHLSIKFKKRPLLRSDG